MLNNFRFKCAVQLLQYLIGLLFLFACEVPVQVERKETIVTTIAGGKQGFPVSHDRFERFYAPISICVDDNLNIYVADLNNFCVRKIYASGGVSTLIGGWPFISTDGFGKAAGLSGARAVTIDEIGNLYIGDSDDSGNDRVRKMSVGGVVTTIAGSKSGYAEGFGKDAQFNFIQSLAVNRDGDVFVADYENNRIRKITMNGMVSTFAGVGLYSNYLGTISLDSAKTFQFGGLGGLVVDQGGDIIVSDRGRNTIFKISFSGYVSVLAGSQEKGFSDGIRSQAKFNYPNGLAIDKNGNIYVADTGNHCIRKITSEGVVSTFAGNTLQGYVDSTSSYARFNQPCGVAIDKNGTLYVADTGNNVIRKITIN
jgi:hypothetical protein